MIQWPDGIVADDRGRAMRQIPQEQTHVTSSLWISEDGFARRRFYNAWSDEFSWGEALDVKLDEQGRVCAQHEGKDCELEFLIAIAWLKQDRPNFSKRVLKIVDADGCVAHNLKWAHAEDDDEEEEDFADETWEPLSIHPFRLPKQYMRSNRNRVKTAEGIVTHGNFYKDKRFVALDKYGLFELREDNQPVSFPSRAFASAAHGLLSGLTPHEYSLQANLTVDTAWTYMTKSLAFVDVHDALFWMRRFIDPALFSRMESMHRDNDVLLGQKLTALRTHMKLLGIEPDAMMSQLRMCRTAFSLLKTHPA